MVFVSVVIPAFNAKETTEIAVDSIRGQTHSDLEILVVVDWSSDGTFDVVEEIGMEDERVCLLTTRGLREDDLDLGGRNMDAGYRARNLCLAKADRDWVMFQDSDGFSLLNRIEVQIGSATADDADVLVCDWFWSDGLGHGFELDLPTFLDPFPDEGSSLETIELSRLAKAGLGFLGHLSPDWAWEKYPFKIKRSKSAGHMFFRDFSSFPGSGQSLVLSRNVLSDVAFQGRDARRGPSRKGRGTDRDFAFQLVSKGPRFSLIPFPPYSWRQSRIKEPLGGIEHFMKQKDGTL